jgi:hypothetical protein
MKNQSFTFKVARPKHREHRVLFDDELPFKYKVERRKDGYQRRPKHRSSSDNWE